MRISDWSSDVCSSDLAEGGLQALKQGSGDAAQALARNVSDACRLADEMAFLVKKGNEIADRLETAISASRKVSPLANPLATHASVAAAVPLQQAPAPAATAERLARQPARHIGRAPRRERM